MAAAQVQDPRRHESIDNLFEYDTSLDDVFNIRPDDGHLSQTKSKLAPFISERQNGLGIDEEVVIAKKRAPVAKLDESRLLSDKGIKRLRFQANKVLKFRGKGHEFSDMQKLLSFYQLWLDDLYPRAKFDDGLVILEKLGHKRSMKIAREGWINEGKPKADYERPEATSEDDYEPQQPAFDAEKGGFVHSHQSVEVDVRSMQQDANTEEQRGSNTSDEPAEDELDALLAEGFAQDSTSTEIHPSNGSQIRMKQKPGFENDGFAEEMAAMAELEAMW